MENRIQRREVYFVFLDPAFGREIGGYKQRPVVVMSINDIHQNTRVVAIVPGTTTDPKTSHPNVVRVDAQLDGSGRPVLNGNGLREATFFQCHQIRAVDQGRMTSRPAGRLSEADFRKVEAAVRHSLGILES
jgi:mRNA-degrading endonuclease toxin of MazEF toxin-antitoxin module